jgi:hypothetical protein
MTEARNLRLIASLRCTEYQTGAKCFIDDALPSGRRRLVVHYDNGGYAGRPELRPAFQTIGVSGTLWTCSYRL